MCDRPGRGESGFTIVECLLAGMMLAAFAAVLARGIAQAATAVERADDQRLAAQWLDDVLTRIDVIGPAELAYAGPFFGTLDERFTWSATYSPQGATDLYEVDVTVRWRTPRGWREVKGHTLLMDPPGWRSTGLTWFDLEATP
jgi:Tfp pilus assembly protein PilV